MYGVLIMPTVSDRDRLFAPKNKEKLMQPHEQRVIDEKNALDTKMDALYAFTYQEVYRNLPKKEQKLLALQFNAMVVYSGILAQRIENFNQESN